MAFDFDTVIDRRGTGAAKWDSKLATHGQPAPGEAFDGDGPAPISMTIADMEFAAPDAVIDAMRARLDHGVFGYTIATDDYRDAVRAWNLERTGWAIEPDWLLTFHGVVPALYLIVRALVPEGGKVILQTPAFPPFFTALSNGPREAISNGLIHEDGRYTMDFDALERSCADPDAAMFILCNPHNPVGRAWTADDLQRVAEICKRHDVMVFADEIHGDLVMPGCRFTPFGTLDPSLLDNCIVANGLSKTMNLAGLRMNNLIVPNQALRERFAEAAMAAGAFGVDPLSMAGLAGGYRGGGPWLDALMAYVEGNWRRVEGFMAERLPAVRVTRPEATYLLWLDLRDLGLEVDDIFDRLTNKARVRLENGTAFGDGGAGFARMNVACPRAMLDDALERIARALGSNR